VQRQFQDVLPGAPTRYAGIPILRKSMRVVRVEPAPQLGQGQVVGRRIVQSRDRIEIDGDALAAIGGEKALSVTRVRGHALIAPPSQDLVTKPLLEVGHSVGFSVGHGLPEPLPGCHGSHSRFLLVRAGAHRPLRKRGKGDGGIPFGPAV